MELIIPIAIIVLLTGIASFVWVTKVRRTRQIYNIVFQGNGHRDVMGILAENPDAALERCTQTHGEVRVWLVTDSWAEAPRKMDAW